VPSRDLRLHGSGGGPPRLPCHRRSARRGRPRPLHPLREGPHLLVVDDGRPPGRRQDP
jgi:hypothetical protein